MTSINSIGSSAADLLAAIRQQLLAKTGTSSDAQKANATGSGLETIISELESSNGNTAGSNTGAANQTTGSGTSGLSSGVLSVLIVLQEQQPSADSGAASQGAPGGPGGGQLFAALDSDGDGQISKSELESAFTAAASSAGVTTDQATQAADVLITKLDTNGDGSVSQAELAAGAPKGHHHHAPAPDAAGGGDPLASLFQSGSASTAGSSTSVTNADGSTTTTVTYADGTKITLSTPATADATSTSSSTSATGTDGSTTAATQSPAEKLLAALIQLQEQAFQNQPTSVSSLAA